MKESNKNAKYVLTIYVWQLHISAKTATVAHRCHGKTKKPRQNKKVKAKIKKPRQNKTATAKWKSHGKNKKPRQKTKIKK